MRHFGKNAHEFLRAVKISGGAKNVSMVKSEQSGKKIFHRAQLKKKTGTRQRLALKPVRELDPTLYHQTIIVGDIISRQFEPKHFTFVPFEAATIKGEDIGAQTYFHKPNAAQLFAFLSAARNKKRAKYEGRELTKEEYELCKKFAKNPINHGVTEELLEQASKELLMHIYTKFDMLGSAEDKHRFMKANLHNILIQGINRNGTLRITLIDV